MAKSPEPSPEENFDTALRAAGIRLDTRDFAGAFDVFCFLESCRGMLRAQKQDADEAD